MQDSGVLSLARPVHPQPHGRAAATAVWWWYGKREGCHRYKPAINTNRQAPGPWGYLDTQEIARIIARNTLRIDRSIWLQSEPYASWYHSWRSVLHGPGLCRPLVRLMIFLSDEDQAGDCFSALSSTAAAFGLRMSWTKTKLQNLGSGLPPVVLCRRWNCRRCGRVCLSWQ